MSELRTSAAFISLTNTPIPSKDRIEVYAYGCSCQYLFRFLQLSGWFLVWRIVIQAMRASNLVVLGTLDSLEAVMTYALTKMWGRRTLEAIEEMRTAFPELHFDFLPAQGNGNALPDG